MRFGIRVDNPALLPAGHLPERNFGGIRGDFTFPSGPLYGHVAGHQANSISREILIRASCTSHKAPRQVKTQNSRVVLALPVFGVSTR